MSCSGDGQIVIDDQIDHVMHGDCQIATTALGQKDTITLSLTLLRFGTDVL